MPDQNPNNHQHCPRYTTKYQSVSWALIVPTLRWQDEQDAEQRRKDAMKLGDDERETILQVIIIQHAGDDNHNVNEDGCYICRRV